MANPDYDSASFEAQLCQIESNLRDAFIILTNDDFRQHLVETEKNLSDTAGLLYQWAGIVSLLRHTLNDASSFADRIRDL